jgi:FAD/FMN-containing dehydrogenase
VPPQGGDNLRGVEARGEAPDEPRGSGRELDRRTFLAGGAALGLGLVLPGCGGGSSSSSSTTTTTSARATGRSSGAKASLADLHRSVRGRVLSRDSSGFKSAAEVYNELYDGAHPVAVVEAATVADVQAAVKWANQREVSVVPRSGGHSYAGYSTGDGVLVIDLKRLSSISLDKSSGIATIGPGAQLIDVYSALSPKGATVPAGSCPSVGLGGLAPGGGMGLAGRRFGLTCDNIAGLEVVTADGRVRKVGPKSEPDLYWAFRGGGGGNFGVATSFQMTSHAVDSAAWFSITWPWSAASDALDAWQDLVPSAPNELTAIFHLDTGGDSPSVSANGQYFGSEDSLRKLLAPLSAIDGADLSVGTDKYMNLMLRWAGCLGKPVATCHTEGTSPGGTMERARFIAKSDYVAKKLPGAGRKALIDAIDRAQSDSALSSAAILLDSYGGKINQVAAEATSFVHRDELFAIQYLTYLPSAGDTGGAERWIEGAWGAMRDYASGMAYQDYIDPKLKGWERAYYGANYDRLRQVKGSYDPDFRFRFKQAIPPPA